MEKKDISKNLFNNKSQEEYWNQLSIQEKKAFLIAKNHLGTSFHIEKSNGYHEWLKKK
jgi:hypothetical protein